MTMSMTMRQRVPEDTMKQLNEMLNTQEYLSFVVVLFLLMSSNCHCKND